MAWEVEAALRKMKNGKEAGKDQEVRREGCSIYRYVNKYNLPLTVLLHANCYTPFHGARERVTSGGAVWLVVPSCICSCNKYVQYVTQYICTKRVIKSGSIEE